MGSEKTVTVDGKSVPGRQLAWGVINGGLFFFLFFLFFFFLLILSPLFLPLIPFLTLPPFS